MYLQDLQSEKQYVWVLHSTKKFGVFLPPNLQKGVSVERQTPNRGCSRSRFSQLAQKQPRTESTQTVSVVGTLRHARHGNYEHSGLIQHTVERKMTGKRLIILLSHIFVLIYQFISKIFM